MVLDRDAVKRLFAEKALDLLYAGFKGQPSMNKKSATPCHCWEQFDINNCHLCPETFQEISLPLLYSIWSCVKSMEHERPSNRWGL